MLIAKKKPRCSPIHAARVNKQTTVNNATCGYRSCDICEVCYRHASALSSTEETGRASTRRHVCDGGSSCVYLHATVAHAPGMEGDRARPGGEAGPLGMLSRSSCDVGTQWVQWSHLAGGLPRSWLCIGVEFSILLSTLTASTLNMFVLIIRVGDVLNIR